MKNVYLVYESNYGSIIFHNGGEATDIIAVCKTKEEAKKISLKQTYIN